VLAKSHVNGHCPATDMPNAVACMADSDRCCPGNDKLYGFIHHSPGGLAKVRTNFEKFLVSPKGKLIKRFGEHY
jgi:glutathione peroxidase-family protein